jgi:predicted PurR-regulated permease PerM
MVYQLPTALERRDPAGRQPRVAKAPSDHRPVAVVGLLVLAIVYTLYFAADLLVPIAVAIFISITCSPVVRYLARWHIPQSL